MVGRAVSGLVVTAWRCAATDLLLRVAQRRSSRRNPVGLPWYGRVGVEVGATTVNIGGGAGYAAHRGLGLLCLPSSGRGHAVLRHIGSLGMGRHYTVPVHRDRLGAAHLAVN